MLHKAIGKRKRYALELWFFIRIFCRDKGQGISLKPRKINGLRELMERYIEMKNRYNSPFEVCRLFEIVSENEDTFVNDMV